MHCSRTSVPEQQSSLISVSTGVEMKHPPSHGPSSEHTDPNNPRAFQNTGVALILSFLCARGEGNVPPSLDVNTHLGCGVTHPTFSFVSCDEDSCLPGQQPKKESSGCSLEGERTEQAAIPPNNIGSSLALNIESWTHHVTVLVFLPHSSVVMITGEGVQSMLLQLFLYLT